MSIKDAKLNFIVDVATDLFLEKGIFAVTIKDIAKKAGVGEATVYRYFLKKQNIVLAVAMKLVDSVFTEYFSMDEKDKGFDNVQAFFTGFYKIFVDHPEFFKFVSDFDAFIAESKCDLHDYESAIEDYYKVFFKSYEQGVKDKSVREVKDVYLYYLSATHALMGLCKKMVSERLLEQDKNGTQEISTLIDIILYGLKGE